MVKYLSICLKMSNEKTPNQDHRQITPIADIYEYTPKGYPPHEFRVKIGAIVILQTNWSQVDGLCNGTRMRVEHCNTHSIRCSVLFGPNAGHEFTFCRFTFNPSHSENRIRFKRFQFPFRLAFAMTINKSQGQTFDRVGLLLKKPVFAHGQLYVALSRVRNFASITLMIHTIQNGIYKQGMLNGYEGGFYTRNVAEKC